MTPAEIPKALANTLREASLTRAGKKTTAAPKAVERPAPMTNAKATPTFSCFSSSTADIVSIQCVGTASDCEIGGLKYGCIRWAAGQARLAQLIPRRATPRR